MTRSIRGAPFQIRAKVKRSCMGLYPTPHSSYLPQSITHQFYTTTNILATAHSLRGGLHSVVSHKSIFWNQEIRQPELWNLAQWEVLWLVPEQVLWRKCIGGLGVKINQLNNQHLCEITGGPPPLLHHHQCPSRSPLTNPTPQRMSSTLTNSTPPQMS